MRSSSQTISSRSAAHLSAATKSAKVIVISGASGSGKTRLAKQLSARYGWPFVNLDDFYFDWNAPGLPRLASGEIDWDDARTWNEAAAIEALSALCRNGEALMPIYSIPDSARTGERHVHRGSAQFVVAEGIFAPDAIAGLREQGILQAAWCLRRNRTHNAFRRLVRDLAQKRKSPSVLVRRGVRLWRAEPQIVAAHVAMGAEPISFRDALTRCRDLSEV